MGDGQTNDDRTTDGAAPRGATQTAPLARRWLIKTWIFIVVLVGFGIWGYWDATVVYPNRGKKYAEYAEWNYLKSAAEAERRSPGAMILPESWAWAADPEAELQRLSSDEVSARNAADTADSTSRRHHLARMETARSTWLASLRQVGMLDAEQIAPAADAPGARLADLDQYWTTAPQPKPLAAHDIPVQWAFVVIGFGGGGALLVLFLLVASKKYRWDPSTSTLTLPGGVSIVPDDLQEVDKRKWDKFIVFLRIKSGHPRAGGQELRFDTYRHAELEEWILGMEKIAFGDEQDDAEATEPEPTDRPLAAPSAGEDDPAS